MLRSCRTEKVADWGRGKGCICVRACVRECMYDVGYNSTWGCTRRLQARFDSRFVAALGWDIGDGKRENGICEITGEKKMGKSDDEMRKTSRQKQHEQRQRRRYSRAKDGSCEADVGTMQGDA